MSYSTDGFSQEFKNLWDTEVLPQVKLCSPEYANMCKLEDPSLSKEDKTKIAADIKAKGYIDVYGQFYIGKLPWAVEHALCDDRRDLNFVNSFFQVLGCLNSESYYTDVFKGKEDTDEYKNLKTLGAMLQKLSKLL